MNPTRQQQLLSLIKRTLSTQLLELNHELFHSVTITDVLLSNDGRECRVFVAAPGETIEKLNTDYRGELQRMFMKQYPRKAIPRLRFYKDTGEIEKMDALLATIEKEEPHDEEPSV